MKTKKIYNKLKNKNDFAILIKASAIYLEMEFNDKNKNILYNKIFNIIKMANEKKDYKKEIYELREYCYNFEINFINVDFYRVNKFLNRTYFSISIGA